MSKHLHAVEFDGNTFGMEIETDTAAYRKFKSQVKYEKVISISGVEMKAYTVPYLFLAAIMREAHWLVSEKKDFNKIWIEDFKEGVIIYVKYTDTDTMDLRDRFGVLGGKREEGEK